VEPDSLELTLLQGSPTLLINGVDPFAAPGQAPGLACRLYRDAAGRVAGAPPVQALRRALEQAGVLGQAASRPQTPLSAMAGERNSSVEVDRLVSRQAWPDRDWGSACRPGSSAADCRR
jgi:hypothetical protein